jgi:putative peptidoglycan lipid II flippase
MAETNHKQQIVRSIGIIMAGVLISRLLGFFREWTVAHLMGSSAITDTYYAAFTVPDFLNYLVAGGALEVIFVPVFTKYLIEEKSEEAWHVFSTVFTFLLVLLVALICLGEVYAYKVVQVIAPGFDPAEKARVVFLTRLMLPAQLFLCLGVLLNAVQNARARFTTPVAGVVVANLGVILGGWLLSSRIGIAGFAVGLLVGNFCGFFLIQAIAVWRLGGRYRPNLDFGHPGFRLFLRLAIPLMLALSVVVTDDWYLRWFGSFLAPASITWLTYSKTLMRMPLTVIGHAIGVASFPFLSQLYSGGKYEEWNDTMNHTIKGLLLFLVPISALTMVLSTPVVYLVFSHTRMEAYDLQATAVTLTCFSIGMFAWGLQNILSRGFYAMRDMVTPAIVGTIFTFINFPVYKYLGNRWQTRGLAVASSWSVIAYTAVIFVLLVRKSKNAHALELVEFFGRVLLACSLPTVICYYLTRFLEVRMRWHSIHGSLELLILVTVVGLSLMVCCAKLFGIREIDYYYRKMLLSFGRPVIPVSN